VRYRSLLISVLIATTASSALLPRCAHAGKFTLGPVLSTSRASFGGDVPPENHYEGITGFGGGIAFDYYLKNDVAISIQPMFIQKGADLVWERSNTELARVDFRSFDFNFLLDSKRSENGVTEDFTDGFESFEVGASFGIGGLIAVGKNYVMIEGRYSQGFSNIASENLTPNDDTTSVKTTGFLLVVGWLFQIGGTTP
jgi:hypothetical protein